jgi:hypothetical protein
VVTDHGPFFYVPGEAGQVLGMYRAAQAVRRNRQDSVPRFIGYSVPRFIGYSVPRFIG